jgi:hypothetical protein
VDAWTPTFGGFSLKLARVLAQAQAVRRVHAHSP